MKNRTTILKHDTLDDDIKQSPPDISNTLASVPNQTLHPSLHFIQTQNAAGDCRKIMPDRGLTWKT